MARRHPDRIDPERDMAVRYVLEDVARRYALDPDAFVRTGTTSHRVARNDAILQLRALRSGGKRRFTLSAIAQFFGLHHTTVLHALRCGSADIREAREDARWAASFARNHIKAG